MVVIVLGAAGQLGKAIQSISSHYTVHFNFFDSRQLDISKSEMVDAAFERLKPDFCINVAAYTAVDKAEIEKDKADLINHISVKNIALACLKHDTTLLHISTDFVFDGEKNSPYLESDQTNPQGQYGISKRNGELEIEHAMTKYFIVRTSWLYSDFGYNFKKTMLKLAQERESLNVVNDQIGAPTHAVDLAKALMKILQSESTNYGIYHYSNEGNTSWFGFAKKIFEYNNLSVILKGIPTSDYPTPAKRPKYSVLDTAKIKKEFNLTIRSWEKALKEN
ncbi:MAG: dTDP-4-dehydrorhamnose reductase [Flavobacterium sp.]|nr:dTDP-4-dehydrorhamnose reductase [Flavobacterium sp.]